MMSIETKKTSVETQSDRSNRPLSKNEDVKEYVVYRTPIGTILLDWNNTLWSYGYPYFSKSCCEEIERGFCEGGKALPAFHAELKNRYGDTLTEKEKEQRIQQWELQRHIGDK